jgi:hypothetical protein
MQAEWPWAGVGFVWMFRRPDWEWHTRPEGYFRLVEPNWQTTPSFDALRKLSQAPTVLHWGRHLPTDPAFVYSGPWRDAVGEDGPVKVGTVGAEVAFGFRGAAFELRVDERSETEPLQVFLVLDGDSEEVEPVSQDGEALVRRAGLDTAAHMAIARVDAGELRLRQVRVEDGQARPRWWPFVVALAVGCAWVGLGLAASMAAILRRR